jgi:hypothetical protein
VKQAAEICPKSEPSRTYFEPERAPENRTLVSHRPALCHSPHHLVLACDLRSDKPTNRRRAAQEASTPQAKTSKAAALQRQNRQTQGGRERKGAEGGCKEERALPRVCRCLAWPAVAPVWAVCLIFSFVVCCPTAAATPVSRSCRV